MCHRATGVGNAWLVWPALCCLVAGCDPGPPELKAPPLDPAAAVAECLKLYDANHDDALDKTELAKVPGILAQLDKYDLDRDGRVTSAELRFRLDRFAESGLALLDVTVRIHLDGQPLEGAEVRFVPEPYFGPAYKPAVGTTDALGMVTPRILPEDMPAAERNYQGMRMATYKVEVRHPTKRVPDKYHSPTTLGYEAALDTYERETPTLGLSSR